MIDLRQLRYFVSIAETGGFHAAAERCGVKQPSLSQQIRRLESSLGVPLFDRVGRTVVLTSAGETLLPHARDILSRVAEARSSVLGDLANGRGRLAVGAIPSVAPFVMPRALQLFRTCFPEAQLVFREEPAEALLDRLIKAEIDIAVVSLPIEDERILYETLGTERLLLAMQASDPRAQQSKLCRPDLEEMGVIVLDDGLGLGPRAREFCEDGAILNRIRCDTTQLSTVLEFIGNGLGVSLIPEMCAATDATGRIRYRPPHDGSLTRTIVAAWHSSRVQTDLAREMVEQVRSAVEESIAHARAVEMDEDELDLSRGADRDSA